MKFRLVQLDESLVPKLHLFELSADVVTFSFNLSGRLAQAS
jgi:hypothetical protein